MEKVGFHLERKLTWCVSRLEEQAPGFMAPYLTCSQGNI